VFFASQDETVNASSTEDAQAGFISEISETITGSDSNAGQADFAVSLSESVTGSDVNAAGAVFVASLLEQFAAADAFTCRYLWELIETSQPPVPPVVISTVATFSGFGFSETSFAGNTTTQISQGTWVDISSNTNSEWTTLDTDQPPGWSIIETV